MPRAVRWTPPAGMEQTVNPQAGEAASAAGTRRAQLPRYLHQLRSLQRHPPVTLWPGANLLAPGPFSTTTPAPAAVAAAAAAAQEEEGKGQLALGRHTGASATQASSWHCSLTALTAAASKSNTPLEAH